MAHDFEETCSRLWHLKNVRRRRRVAKNGGGVEVVTAAAKGIGKLTELHTLGVVNVAGGTGALLFLKELKKLTQLRKLGLSGITCENWKKLCCAISGHRHLKILALQLLLLEGGSYDFARFDDIFEPPKTLMRLKVLYTGNAVAGAAGCAWIRPTWIIQPRNLKRFDHALTISSQEDADLFAERFSAGENLLRIKPIEKYLNFARGLALDTLSIDCSSTSSTVTFEGLETFKVKELNIHCCSSCGLSCLRIFGLKCLQNLEQVLVSGPCSNTYEQDLRRELREHPDKPELKLL